MAVVFGAIADDFTGATDLASLLARSGHRVNLRIGVPDSSPDDTAAFEIVALKCRTVAADLAVAEALKALRWLRAAGATCFYWKYCSTFDSTAKGNIGTVAEALMMDLGKAQAIYCPAFPENGRTVFMGNLFVGEQLLSESPMRDHPLTPMRDSSLVRLLEPQVRSRVGLANRLVVAAGCAALSKRLERLRAEGVAHVIVDAVANEDLETIAQATIDMTLMTGGSALAMPIPALLQRAGKLPPPPSGGKPASVQGGSIVLSGSCSAMTRRQVARYAQHAAAYRLDPVRLAEEGPEAALEWLAAQSPDAPGMVYATAEPDEVARAQAALGAQRAGALVETALAAVATRAFELGVRRFVVAGGETSGAVVQALATSSLAIGPEIASGVPWTFGSSQGKPVALALKSGNFGAESFFDDAWRILEEQ